MEGYSKEAVGSGLVVDLDHYYFVLKHKQQLVGLFVPFKIQAWRVPHLALR